MVPVARIPPSCQFRISCYRQDIASFGTPVYSFQFIYFLPFCSFPPPPAVLLNRPLAAATPSASREGIDASHGERTESDIGVRDGWFLARMVVGSSPALGWLAALSSHPLINVLGLSHHAYPSSWTGKRNVSWSAFGLLGFCFQLVRR